MFFTLWIHHVISTDREVWDLQKSGFVDLTPDLLLEFLCIGLFQRPVGIEHAERYSQEGKTGMSGISMILRTS